MEIKYSFICDFANIDASGKVNVIGIFQHINSARFPFVYPGLTYAASLEFSPSEAGKHQIRICFLDYDGKDVLPPREAEIEVKKPEGKNYCDINILMQFSRLKLSKPGPIQIDLVVDNQRAASNTIYVNEKPGSPRLH